MPNWRDRLVQFVTTECRPIDKLSHMQRLVPLTRLVGAGLTYDDDIVFAAVWLHDLGVFIGHRPEEPAKLAVWDHTTYAMAQSPKILTELGFPVEKIDRVIEVIRTHQPQDNPQTIEGTILRDADILEQLGAVTILRTAAKVGRDTRFAQFDDVISALTRQRDRLPSLIRLESAQQLAKPRIDFLNRFLESWSAEAVRS
ncbi:MAG: hypothetical protein U0798_06040 [Gemmataceae bacterium]